MSTEMEQLESLLGRARFDGLAISVFDDRKRLAKLELENERLKADLQQLNENCDSEAKLAREFQRMLMERLARHGIAD